MKLLFSEAPHDYGNYLFPYAVWALPEKGETPATLFQSGFLPSSRTLDRFYLCRQIRVDLKRFHPSSENRRILRKGQGLSVQLVPRREFHFTPARSHFCKTYADIKFGNDVMTAARLESLFHAPITSHVMIFTDAERDQEVGLATLYLEEPQLGFYYYAFYDLNYYRRNLGMFMMTSAVQLAAERPLRHLHLGTCYSENALYKAQFAGAEFFNGFRWSDNLKELKYLIRRDRQNPAHHLLESQEFRERFYPGPDSQTLARQTAFTLRSPSRSDRSGSGRTV